MIGLTKGAAALFCSRLNSYISTVYQVMQYCEQQSVFGLSLGLGIGFRFSKLDFFGIPHCDMSTAQVFNLCFP